MLNMNATTNQVIAIHSCSRKVDLSKSIKLTTSTKGGFTIDQIAKMSALSSYLKGGVK